MKIKLPVTWQMSGIIEVEADSIQDAIDNFEPDDVDLPDNDEPDTLYVDSSFALTDTDTSYVKMFNEENVPVEVRH
jgi:hypothetical protein